MTTPLDSRSLARRCAPLLFCLALNPLQGQTAAPPSAPAAAAATDPTVLLPDFDVSSNRDVGYGARDSMGATRMDVDLDKTPTTVVVLDQEFLKDLGALEPNTALAFVSGMNNASTQYTGQIAIRGFNQAGVTYRDGLPQSTAVNGTQLVDMADIERIEVIKGPEGVLYGSEAGGGVVNSVTKRPLGTEMNDVTFQAGSWNLYRGTIDSTGPIDQNGKLLYRIVVDDQEGYTQIKGGTNNVFFVAPSLTYRISQNSEFTVHLAYGHWEKDVATNPWFADAGVLSTFLNVRGNFDEFDEVTQEWQYLLTATFEQRLGDNWSLRLVYRENQTDENKIGYNKTSYTFINAAGTTVGTVGSATSTIPFSSPNWTDILANRQRKNDKDFGYDYGPYMDLVGHSKWGPVTNTLLFSLAYEDTLLSTREVLTSYPSTSVINPVHNALPAAIQGPPPLPNINQQAATPDASVGAVDNIGLFSDKLIFSLGERRDAVDSYSFNRSTAKGTQLKTDGANGVSYKAGVVFRPIEGLALFYDYADTFTPISGSTYEGIPYKPEIGGSEEGGIKLDLFGGKLTGTASYFDIKQNNVPESEIVNPLLGTTGNEQIGFIKVRGWEADLAGQPLPGLNILAAYGNLDSVTDKGLPQRNVPIGGNFKTLAKYSFDWALLKGFSLGVGYIYNARRSGDTGGTFFLPAYEEYDAFAIYQLNKHWRFQINGNNLKNSSLDGVSSVNNEYVYAGRPRSCLTSVEYRW